MLEAHPLSGREDEVGASDAYEGMASTFRELGSYEVGTSGKNRGQPRLIMRYDVGEP